MSFKIPYTVSRANTRNCIVWEREHVKIALTFCAHHGLDSDCDCSTSLSHFDYSFVIKKKSFLDVEKTKNKTTFWAFPPPTLWTKKIHSLFNSFVREDNHFLTDYKRYMKIKSEPLIGGPLKTLTSGKDSHVRRNMLGYTTPGSRFTITIDSSLPPDIITLPKWMNCENEWFLINRPPSINTTCIYAVKAKLTSDDTAHINPFMLYGLGADQDGDTAHFIKMPAPEKNFEPNFNHLMSTFEILNLSWSLGRRCDTLGKINFLPEKFLSDIP